MTYLTRIAVLLSVGAVLGTPAAAQAFPTDDPVLRHMWDEGMERSQAYGLAQTLLDSIGPRLTGTPQIESGSEWLVQMYRRLGVEADNERYGTWMRWRRGRTHVDLVEPRVRTLEATLLAWSAGTGGRSVRGEVVIVPDVQDSAEFEAWLPSARGKFVAISFAEPTCRPDRDWEQWATEETFERMREERTAAREAWTERFERAGFNMRERGAQRRVAERLEAAEVAGVLTSRWSRGWGVQKIFNASSRQVPTLDLSCEDYGLLFRLAQHSQHPVIDVSAEGEFLGEGPVFNTIARIPGTELPNEYVMLSAHFDSWDGASGATDNGTGTITMLEAMRILSVTYPRPRRTILVGHWGGEEQGLNGSRAFAADHPEVLEGLQALFNQDNGTGRVVNMSSSGFTGASESLARWLAHVPGDITQHIRFRFPGTPPGGGSDHASFVCHETPGFGLGSLSWSYGTYTWHTNRDTFDKISFDDLRNNATLTAMLVYLASEDPERVSRQVRTEFPPNRFSDQPGSWPACQAARRSWEERRP